VLSVLLQLLVIGLCNGAIIGMNAMGVTLIYGTVRQINLAHGDTFALASVLAATVATGLALQYQLPALPLLLGVLLMALLSMLAAAAISVLVERLAFRPFRNATQTAPLAPVIATLGISFMLYQFALVWRTWLPSWNPGEHRSVPGVPELPRQSIAELVPPFDFVKALGIPLDFTFTLKDLLVLLIALGAALALSWVLRRTRLGKAIRACAQDPKLAQLVGVNIERAFIGVFAVGGAMAGLAAFIFAAYYTHPFSNHGAQSGLIAFAAAIMGGVGSPRGAMWSGLLLGVVGALSDYFLAGQWTPVLLQLLLIGMLLLRPQGLLGDDRSEDAATGTRLNLTALFPGRLTSRGRWLALFLLAAGALYPLVERVAGTSQLTVLTGIMALAVMALGLNLLLGIAGVLDLGFAVSFGIGAYVAAFLTDGYGWIAHTFGLLPNQPMNYLIVLPIAACAAGLFGLVNGLLTLRVRSDYLAIMTLAFGQMAVQVLNNFSEFTGGFGGISALPAPNLFGVALKTPLAQYYLILVVIVVVAIASQRLIGARVGRAWTAMGADEMAAASNGINPAHYRVLAFVVSTSFAGIAGALFANTATFITPELTDFPVSSQALAMVIMGGAGSVPGTIAGAFLIAAYDRIIIPAAGAWLDRIASGGVAFDLRNFSYFAFGLVLYLTVLLRSRQKASA